MRPFLQKSLVGALSLLVSVLSCVPMLLLVSAVYMVLLRLPLAQGPGAWQAVKVVSGGALLLVLPLAWLSLVAWSFEYFTSGVRNGTLGQRFALLCAMILYVFPLLVLVYEIVFPSAMFGLGMALPVADFRADLVLAGGGLLLGTAMLVVHRVLSTRRAHA